MPKLSDIERIKRFLLWAREQQIAVQGISVGDTKIQVADLALLVPSPITGFDTTAGEAGTSEQAKRPSSFDDLYVGMWDDPDRKGRS